MDIVQLKSTDYVFKILYTLYRQLSWGVRGGQILSSGLELAVHISLEQAVHING